MSYAAFCDGNINTVLSKLCANDTFADVVFLTHDKIQIPAHRVLLAARSEVFNSLLYGSEAESKEKPLEIILDDDVTEKSFRSLLKFIYTDSVEISDETSTINLTMIK